MPKQHFIFLLKDDVITPQSLEESDAGDVIKGLLYEHFFISHVHVMATDNHDALRKFNLLTVATLSPTELKRDVVVY